MDGILMRNPITRRSLLLTSPAALLLPKPALAQFGHPVGQVSYPAAVGGGFVLVNSISASPGASGGTSGNVNMTGANLLVAAAGYSPGEHDHVQRQPVEYLDPTHPCGWRRGYA